MNKAELADAIAADLDTTRKAALEAIDAVLDNIVHAVIKGDKVSLVGFGTFEKVKRAARNGRNPQTGAVVKIAATSVPKFKAGAEFKGLVSGKKKQAFADKYLLALVLNLGVRCQHLALELFQAEDNSVMANEIGRVDKGLAWHLVALILRPLMAVFTKKDWRNRNNIHTQTGIIFAGNHISWFDPFPVSHFLWANNRPPIYLGKQSIFKVPIIGALLRSLDQIPVERVSQNAANALVLAEPRLQAGEAVVIYPEGTISRDPNLWPMRGKTGAVRLALSSSTPIIPFAQWGAQSVIPPYEKKLRLFPRKTMQINVGKPLDLSKYQGRDLTDELLYQATEDLMEAITNLLSELRGEEPPTERFTKEEWLDRKKDSQTQVI